MYAEFLKGLGLIGMVLAVQFVPVRCASAQGAAPIISSPAPDEVLQGQVVVTGTADGQNFGSAEVAFAYAADSTDTWFVIQRLSKPIENAVLANWDTALISDGDYVLRLRVKTADGTLQEARVPVHVANYTAFAPASATPTPTRSAVVLVPPPLVLSPSETPIANLAATPTLLPSNPAAITGPTLYGGLWRGAAVVLAGFLVLGAILLRRR